MAKGTLISHTAATMQSFTLEGKQVRLEPLEMRHVEPLTAASGVDPALYKWSAVPIGLAATEKYVETAMAWHEAETAVPFAVVRLADGEVIGSTRFFDMERWPWPADHPNARRGVPDACEIGYTWYTKAAIRTAANTEAKLMMLTHAFEVWEMARVCLHTDERNERSRAAMERLGCTFEGILRSHRLAVDLIPRNSARYSIVAAEWPEVKLGIERMRAKYDE